MSAGGQDPGLIIAGTAAGCGKSAVAAGILHRLRGRGMRVAAARPGEDLERLGSENDLLLVERALEPGDAAPGPERGLALRVLLVVGLRDGCLKHAQLAASAIGKEDLRLAGWIGNTLDPAFEPLGASLNSLREMFDPVPCLGVVDFHADPTPARVANHLRPDRLLAAAGYVPETVGAQSRNASSKG